MLASNIYKNLCRVKLINFGGTIAHISGFFDNTKYTRSEHKNLPILGKPILPQYRHYSGETGARLPPLTDFPPKLWPGLFKTLRNMFFVNMVIIPQYDADFDINTFISGSKHALYVVANALAREDYQMLDGLVTPDVIQNLRHKISSLTDEQKRLISVEVEDIYLSFSYDVDIIQEQSEGDRDKTFVEITVLHHMLRGLSRMKAAGEEMSFTMGMRPEFRERSVIANYRFIREYTKGVDSPWIINMVNHFMPVTLA